MPTDVNRAKDRLIQEPKVVHERSLLRLNPIARLRHKLLKRMDGYLHRAAKGDKEAMAQIVQEHYASVYRFCARRIGEELGKDASQETFITAFKTLRRYNGSSTLLTWLLGIANNHCRNLARKTRTDITLDIWESACSFGTGVSLENALVDKEALRTALKRLTVEHREVVLLHEIEGLSYEEAAQILAVPVGTIKSRLHHAFLALRKQLVPAEGVSA